MYAIHSDSLGAIICVYPLGGLTDQPISRLSESRSLSATHITSTFGISLATAAMKSALWGDTQGSQKTTRLSMLILFGNSI